MSNIEESDDLAPPPGVSGGGPYAIFQNRDFTFYLVSRLVGITGQQMFTLAILWEIWWLTQSALALGLVGLVQMIPMFLFTLPAGHVADNYNRKQIVVLTTAAIAAASLGVAFISWYHAPVIWIYFCLFLGSTANTFMRAANAAFLPALVSRNDFPRAVNWNAGAFQLSCIIGRVAAGGLIAWMVWRYFNHLNDPAAAAPVYVINALASVVVCVLVGMIRREHTVKVRESMTLQALLTGFKFVYASKIIFGLITLDMFAVFLGGATALLPIYAANILFVGPIGLGFLAAALPLGSILCVFILNHRPPLQKAGRTLLWAVTVFGLATIAFGLSKSFWFSFLMMFLCGAVDNISVVVRHTLVQMLTPDDKRGRVSAVNNLFIGTSNELGEFESGTVAQIFGPAIGNTMVTGAIISAVSGGVGTVLTVIAVALIWPEIRRYGKLA
ncbi:MAG TPA: MFS transporter [Candidatus Limnocylindrales bacterium]|nr:MFS transporter [Candidatus Limnocylindrales bacterium]